MKDLNLHYAQAETIGKEARSAFAKEIAREGEPMVDEERQAKAVLHAAEAALIAYSGILCRECGAGHVPWWDNGAEAFVHKGGSMFGVTCPASHLRHILMAWSYHVQST